MRRLLGIITPLVIGLLSAGFVTAGPAAAQPARASDGGLNAYYGQRLAWAPCKGGFQCAKLKVPLDYTKPSGKRIEIAVIKLPAKGGKRLGSVVTNFGGPGGSGIDLLRATAKTKFTATLRSRFDLVSFDPRGVGASAPVRCMPTAVADWYHSVDDTPDSRAEVKMYNYAQLRLAQACQANSGALLPFVGTPNAARDMDVLRAGLGESRLTYIGFSYGTLLGATYANLFPARVHALVLDGAEDPSVNAGDFGSDQNVGFGVAFDSFASDCFKHKDCPFTKRTAAKRMRALHARTEKAPLVNTYDGRQATQAIVYTGIQGLLYDQRSWPALRQALGRAFKGDGTLLLQYADQYNARGADATYANLMEAHTAIDCLDHPTWRQAVRHAKAISAGKLLASPCDFWPVRSKTVNKAIHAKGAPPILVVGTLRDPATPYKWAKALAAQLSSGVLLSFDGDGHTAYSTGSACVDKTVDRYLITRVPPRDGKMCPKI
ncbi:alpha/beta hydrolase [Nonomuraea sp. NEAU-A123]|uniref:alpha/beta fold hydrolase n=1 Tax=Nonomuraea sp. NEAU-A123 TaxID=2839649 RepID=UPI001BE4119E|nr:alpha/beta hydrolase [Nonomuraea sp. NEAU-A123]MBT2235299.1 alpha/beta hydrolase [Nonomuraea sp. NEAU-A123]